MKNSIKHFQFNDTLDLMDLIDNSVDKHLSLGRFNFFGIVACDIRNYEDRDTLLNDVLNEVSTTGSVRLKRNSLGQVIQLVFLTNSMLSDAVLKLVSLFDFTMVFLSEESCDKNKVLERINKFSLKSRLNISRWTDKEKSVEININTTHYFITVVDHR